MSKPKPSRTKPKRNRRLSASAGSAAATLEQLDRAINHLCMVLEYYKLDGDTRHAIEGILIEVALVRKRYKPRYQPPNDALCNVPPQTKNQ